MLLSEWHYKCPKCGKKIKFEAGKPKAIIKCSKCSLFLLLIRGESRREVFDLLTNAEGQFLDFNIYLRDIYYLLVGTFDFAEDVIQLLSQRSKKLGDALKLFLFGGNKKKLTTLQKNIMYKLKAENIQQIQDSIEEKIKYLQAKIKCIKLLRIIDF